MLDTINRLIDNIIEVEGGFSDHPSDPGKTTMYGITESVARQNGYTGHMRDMPQKFAREIYYNRYVVEPGFDKVLLLSPIIAGELIDTGVNMGTKVSAQFLQRCLNAFNLQGSAYSDLVVDGAIGNATIQALKSYMTLRKADAVPVILSALNCLQGARYIEIIESRPTSESFVFGWFKNRVKL